MTPPDASSLDSQSIAVGSMSETHRFVEPMGTGHVRCRFQHDSGIAVFAGERERLVNQEPADPEPPGQWRYSQ